MSDYATRLAAREGSMPLGLAYRQGLLSPRVVGLLRVAGDADLGLEPVRLAQKRMHHALPEREQRIWACDCAERALLREREAGREPAVRSWEAIRVARLYADGFATREELAAAAAAAWDAASGPGGAPGGDRRADAAFAADWVAWNAAWVARDVSYSAWAAAETAASAAVLAAALALAVLGRTLADRAATRAAERAWQEERLRYWARAAAERLAGQ